MTTVIDKCRNLIGDILKTDGRDVFSFDSITSSRIFTLTEANVSTTTILVYKNGSLWANTNYSYSANTGKLTVTGTLTAGDSLEVDYSYYQKYSDNEISGFIKAAVSYLAIEKYGTFTVKSDNVIFPTPNETEENLLAIVASIIIRGDVISYRTPELTITFARTDTIETKIKKFVRQCKKSYGYLTYIDLTKTMVYDDLEDTL